MRVFARVSFLILAFVASFISPFVSAGWAADLDEFERRVAALAAGDNLVGLAVGVVRDGEIVLLKTYGERSVGGDMAIGPQTTFRIASLSKGFAATLAAQLVEEEKLSLFDKAAQFSPALRLKDPAQASAVTLEHLLSHRLGLPPYAYDNLLEADIEPKTILGRFSEVKPVCRVGQCYAYQNVGFNMIADAIAQAHGASYAQAIEDRLFAPLGLSGASVDMEGLQKNDDWARPHRRGRNGSWRVVDVKQAYYNLPAAGGVNASISDMTVWLNAQMGNAPRIVSAKARALMHTPRVATPAEKRRLRQMKRVKTAHYGLGWRIYDYAGQEVITHAGSVEGYSAQIAFLPERNVGIVVLTNSRSKEFWSILPTFLDIELNFDTDKVQSSPQ